MTKHMRARCGLESRCSHGNWADRHPAAAVVFALLAGYSLVSVILAYPWFLVPVLVVAAAVWVDRRNRKQAALVAPARPALAAAGAPTRSRSLVGHATPSHTPA